jgi:DNA-binding transcriptional regulator YiaG
LSWDVLACNASREVSEEVHMSALIAEVRAARTLPPPAMAREIRRAASVSRARLAEELGIHPTTVARWESGIRAPRGELRTRYGRLLAELRAEVSGDAA